MKDLRGRAMGKCALWEWGWCSPSDLPSAGVTVSVELLSIWERLVLNPHCLAYILLAWRQLCEPSCSMTHFAKLASYCGSIFFLTYDWALKSRTVSHWAGCYGHFGCVTNLATEVKEEVSILWGQNLGPAAGGGWQQRKTFNGKIQFQR